jgi:hypothetical protein
VKTLLIVTIEHKKPLPVRENVTDIASQRLYSWLYSQGVEAGVRASLVQEKPEMWEAANASE